MSVARSRGAKESPAKTASIAEKRLELVFEIGCEEIPAGMLVRAEEELRGNITKLLTAENVMDGVTVESFSGPRRLTAWVRGIIAKQADVVNDVTGPPKSVAYDHEGHPTRAALSFAEKQGLQVAELFTVQTPKGEYLAAKQTKRGRTAQEILSDILPRAIHDLTWPRSMTWTGLDGARFIRPIRWLLAVLDRKALRFSYGGVTSGEKTRGHRFIGKGEIAVSSFADYEKKLAANGVIVRPELRREKIEKELAQLARKGGYQIHEDAGLKNLVCYLNEHPTVIEGEFDSQFLNLPDEILITVMRDHQKYFAVENKRGELMPRFLAVINLKIDPRGLVRAGHERVLRARFADAQFFWKSDQKHPLGNNLPKLERVTYESRLGSYRDKVERIRSIARWLTEQWYSSGMIQARVAEADRAAELAKCDLASEMVREFTELQGVVGGLYARAQGEPDEVADAIYDHYLPAGLTDSVPRNVTGCAVALADKLDSIAGCFTVGLVPSGSSDPYALRRAALGIVKIILEKKLPVSLSLAVGAAAKALLVLKPKKGMTPEQEAQVLDFILERAKFVLRDHHGFAYDEVNAVFRAGGEDLVDAQRRLVALKSIRRSKNFEPLAVSFKRVRKILEKAESGNSGRQQVQPELFKHDAEKELYSAMRSAAARVQDNKRAGEYEDALETIAGMRKAIDRYFEDVMVMVEDEKIRANRLTMLGELLKEFTTVADFSEIAAEERH